MSTKKAFLSILYFKYREPGTLRLVRPLDVNVCINKTEALFSLHGLTLVTWKLASFCLCVCVWESVCLDFHFKGHLHHSYLDWKNKTDVIFPLLTSFCVCLCTHSAYKAQSSMCSFCPDYCYSHSHLWSLALKRSQICQSSSLVPTWHRQCTEFMLIVSLLLLML